MHTIECDIQPANEPDSRSFQSSHFDTQATKNEIYFCVRAKNTKKANIHETKFAPHSFITLVSTTPGNAPPTSRLRFPPIDEGDTLQKMDPSCIQKNTRETSPIAYRECGGIKRCTIDRQQHTERAQRI